ncbi:TetR/AcrR family transcriptional regulator [Actinokineospora sp. G85]|uniref:TetR/AcrR family transcriptional regulator n=1 Tax=Actinokineospora sp. G85 TaxID=3406626 RepID=UPI003C71A81A
MPRLTRVESQARTRELLIATAKDLFLRDGYHATSLEKVAEAAGFSKGAVYSNFRNKDELCLVVLDDIHAEHIKSVGQAIAGRPFDDAVALFSQWAERMIGDEGWTVLEVEFGLQARRDPALRAELAARDQAVRDAITALARTFDDSANPAPLPPAELATALLSLGIGLGIQRVIDPAIEVSILADTLRALLGVPRPDQSEKDA